MKLTNRKLVLAMFGLVLFGSLAIGFVHPSRAVALSGAQWQPGYIIDDSLFHSSNLMGANDIQTFLSAKVPVCDTNGTQASSHWYAAAGRYYTRAEWGSMNSAPAPYTCLKDYTQSVPQTNPDSFCAGGVSAGTKSAAMIIAEVANACSVNPEVLIVLLQKEQSLVTDDWPWPIEYRSATGYGCPDTAACDSQYYGFFNQVYNAARQFQRYKIQSNLFNFRAGVTSTVQYNPNSSCGGSAVYMQNNATAALYNYTPYQPNQPALDNLYGSGDGCSSYGNRNFWRMYNDWFGPTLGSLVKTPYDNTVYLLNDTVAQPIQDINVLNDYSALGPVRVTSAGEINTHSAGPVLGHVVSDSNGTVYLINANIKLPFTDCASVADYGYNCSQVTQLNTLLLNKLQTGPPISPLLKSVSNGTIYYISGGVKRPIVNWNDYLSFHIPILNVLTDAMVNQIPTSGIPAHGSGVLVKTANSPTVYIVKDINNLIPVSNFVYPKELGLNLGIRTIASNYTVDNSIENKVNCGGSNYLATNGVLYPVPSGLMAEYGFSAGQFLGGGLLCSNVAISSQPLDRYIRTGNGSIFYVSGDQKQPFAGYGAYVAHGGGSGNTLNVSDFLASMIPTGTTLY